MVGIVSSSPFSGDGNIFTLSNGSTPGRALIIVGAQERGFPNIENFTFDGVSAGVGNITINDPASSGIRAIIAVFEDSDLPATAGDYLVSRNTDVAGGTVYAVIEVTGYTPGTFISGDSAPDEATNPFSIDYSPAAQEDMFFLAFRQKQSVGSNVTVTNGTAVLNNTEVFLGYKPNTDDTDLTELDKTNVTDSNTWVGLKLAGAPSTPTLRKSSQFTVETTLAGTVTSATLNGAAITVDSQAGATVTLTDSDGSITTSGEYDLVLTDDAAATETITVQVNVYGVAPSNNPLQKDGAALASLTNVEVRVSAGATLAGSQLFYSGTATTDASGNLGNIDLSSTAAADADPVLLSIRTAAGDSIIASETVGII